MYVLDPLEEVISRAPQEEEARPAPGIAVGMGLLSSILSPSMDESILITGTIVSRGDGDVALEIVLSLRQVSVLRMEYGVLALSSTTTGCGSCESFIKPRPPDKTGTIHAKTSLLSTTSRVSVCYGLLKSFTSKACFRVPSVTVVERADV